MIQEIKAALQSLYDLHQDFDKFAAKAPLKPNAETDAKIDEYDEKFDAAEKRVYDLAQTFDDEDEAFSILSLMQAWYRIPRYLQRHAA